MKKFFKLALTILALYALQTSLLPLIAVNGISPDLMLLATVSYAFLRGAKQGALMGFCIGLLEDLSSGTFLGINAFTKLVIGLFFGRFSEGVFKEQFFLPVFASVGATLLNYFILAIIMLLLGYRFNPLGTMELALLPMLLYQLAFAYPVHRLLYELDKKLNKKEKH